MTFDLYGFWRSLATFRVRVALNLKGLDYREHPIDLFAGEQQAASFRAINPMAAVPALVEHGHPPLTQSLAILEYLEEVYPDPPLLPASPRARAQVRALALIVAADAHPLVVPRVRNYLSDVLKLEEPVRMAWIEHWSRTALGALEAQLGPVASGQYCVGPSPTIADICLTTHVVGSRLFKFDLADFPACARIADQCLQLDAFARAHPLKQPGAPAAH
jgi:maleylacetoacetate isomerase